MLVAVHPDNKELHSTDYPMCFTQGQLLYALHKNPQEEVLLDETLPGYLKTDDLITYINTNFPSVQISIIDIPMETDIRLPMVTIMESPVGISNSKNSFKIPVIIGASIALTYMLLTFGGEQHLIPMLTSVGIGTAIGVVFLR